MDTFETSDDGELSDLVGCEPCSRPPRLASTAPSRPSGAGDSCFQRMSPIPMNLSATIGSRAACIRTLVKRRA